MLAGVATLQAKIRTEMRVREMVADNGIPEPDYVEYGYGCIRVFWVEPKVVLVVDIDEVPAEEDDEAGFGDRGA
jgi:hypothetical protein